MKQPTTNDLDTRQRHQLGAALDCMTDGGSHLAQLASDLPLRQRITVLLCLTWCGRIESRLARLLALPTPTPAPEPQPQPASAAERVA